MDVGAIVIVEAQGRYDESSSQSNVVDSSFTPFVAGETLAFVDLLGQSVLEHTIDRLLAIDSKFISLIVPPELATSIPVFRRPLNNLALRVADEPWRAVAQVLEEYRKNGCNSALVVKPTAYIEADLFDFLDFHCQGRRTVTRASDREGKLDLWAMSCEAAKETAHGTLGPSWLQADFFPPSYFVKEYVRRFSHAQDFRELVTDAFLSRCRLRPMGEQRRPRVWADRGVEIRRGARIVGPAYLGAGCTIGERAVITRFSNIERNSYIDYGTVVESSSVLPDTSIGVWLDVRRSIVHGNKLFSLDRGVLVEVSDPRLLRFNTAVRSARRTRVAVPEHKYGSSLPRVSVIDGIRSINTSTEFES